MLGDHNPRVAQIDACISLAREAQASGDKVTMIAALQLAAQLIRLAKLQRATTILHRSEG
jgi:hypothetical protein